jgi:hypothetical protein
LSVIILDPRTQPDPADNLVLSPRPKTLAGKRIGLLDNHKPNAQRLLGHLAVAINQVYPAATFTRATKPSASTGVPLEIVNDLKNSSDLVIAGVGD